MYRLKVVALVGTVFTTDVGRQREDADFRRIPIRSVTPGEDQGFPHGVRGYDISGYCEKNVDYIATGH